MNRQLVKGLQVARELPALRSGAQHLIDLDEVTVLLGTLCISDRDGAVERGLLSLLRCVISFRAVVEPVA
jgi:hypothetical protein